MKLFKHRIARLSIAALLTGLLGLSLGTPSLANESATGNLDSATAEKIIELLFALNQGHGTTLVLVTHDLGLAQRCQRRLKMEAGVLAEEL